MTFAVNFTNILRAAFSPISFCQKIQTYAVGTKKLLKRLSYKKAAHKMLVKLTQVLAKIGLALILPTLYTQLLR